MNTDLILGILSIVVAAVALAVIFRRKTEAAKEVVPAIKVTAPSEIKKEAPVAKAEPADAPPPPTLGQALDKRTAEARAKVATLEASVHADLDAAKAEVAKLEAEAAAMPPHLRDSTRADVVARVDHWFKE